MCRDCSQATVDEDDDSSQFMTLVAFRQEEKRARLRKQHAEKKEKVHGPEAYIRLETQRKQTAEKTEKAKAEWPLRHPALVPVEPVSRILWFIEFPQ